MAKLVAGESRLRGRVYIPKVYRELSSKRVMTAEWIEGVRLWDKETLTRPWQGRWRQGSPGCGGAPLDAPDRETVAEVIRNHPAEEHLKPNREWWKGPNGKGGLGVSLKDTMQTMVDLFSAQMFLWGCVSASSPWPNSQRLIPKSSSVPLRPPPRQHLHPQTPIRQTRTCPH